MSFTAEDLSFQIYKMNAFFVAFVVLGSALSAQSACTFPYGGDGGVLENGAYKPGIQFTLQKA